MLTMVTSSAMPGKKLIQYLPERRCVKPFEMRSPSDGEVIGMPSPRNESVASSAIAWATCTVATTMSGGRQLGRMWRNSTRGVLYARHTAASTYSLRFSTSALPRTVRA